MDRPLFQRPQTPNFSDPAVQKAFIEGAVTGKELLQKELLVLQAERVLLEKRIRTMQELLNELSASDSQYPMLAGQIQMDFIELGELKVRQASLEQKMREEH